MGTTKDVLAGQWHELKGHVQEQWGKLTDDEIAQLSGKKEELAGVLRQRYGYDQAKAEKEINKWVYDHNKREKA